MTQKRKKTDKAPLIKASEFATPERAKKEGGVTMRALDIDKNAKVVQVQQVAMYPDYLVFLKINGLLGAEPDSSSRYDCAARLKEIYYDFKSSGKSMTGEPSSTDKIKFITDGEIGDRTDIAETEYNAVMSALPMQYRRIIRYICIEDIAPCRGTNDFHALIRDAIDALYGAFQRIDKKTR